MRSKIARLLRKLADWAHPASRQPCVVVAGGGHAGVSRVYIDGVEYVRRPSEPGWGDFRTIVRQELDRARQIDIEFVRSEDAKQAAKRAPIKRPKGSR